MSAILTLIAADPADVSLRTAGGGVVFNSSVAGSEPVLVKALIKIGAVAKPLAGLGGDYTLYLLIDNIPVQPSPQTFTFSTDGIVYVNTDAFIVPGLSTVTIKVYSPNAGDTSVTTQVTFYQLDTVQSSVGSVTGSVGSVVGDVGGNVNGNVLGAVAAVAGDIGGDVLGSVGSVVGDVGGSVASVIGDVGGSVASVTANVNAVLIDGAHGGPNATLELYINEIEFEMPTSGYASVTSLNVIFGSANVSRWADINSNGDEAEKTSRIEWAISLAEAYVNDRLRDGPYTVPFELSELPVAIVDCTARLAGVYLYESRGITDADESNQLQKHRERAENTLTAILGGKLKLSNEAEVRTYPSAIA